MQETQKVLTTSVNALYDFKPCNTLKTVVAIVRPFLNSVACNNLAGGRFLD